ncbi:MAG: phosphoribosylglycinamide formyltransferase [Bacteroidetes bacterium]|nr:phosphoribosylglycinamide formyltransferase [Bacteroidota bacterium]
MQKLAIFASGNGTNAQRIIEYFFGHPDISINLVVTNNSDAYVLTRAANMGIPALIFDKSAFNEGTTITNILLNKGIDYIILAGFLCLIPANLLSAFSGRILNIHPALLPKFGGKGMYGQKVHEAVIAAHETESGITIHHVNEYYDEGKIIFNAKCPVAADDSIETLAKKVHELEYRFYPEVIEQVIMRTLKPELGK